MFNMPYSNGEFVCSKNKLNYKDVLDDFKNAKCIRILTYNISKSSYSNTLIDALKNVAEDVDVQIITNIPSRFPNYQNSQRGKNAKQGYRENYSKYLEKLNPDNFKSNPFVGFNFANHGKIVGTDNIVYVGSANYSDESKNNIESGTIIRDKKFILKLYDELFPIIVDESVPYFDDDFNVLRLFIISMENKFSTWFNIFTERMITHYPDTKKKCLRNSLLFDEDDLEALFVDLEELSEFSTLIESTYSMENIQYIDIKDKIKIQLDCIDLNWMLDFTNTDSEFYFMLKYDEEEKALEYLEEYLDAYGENLNDYAERAINESSKEYERMKSETSLVLSKPNSEHSKSDLEDLILCLSLPYAEKINLILTVPSFKNIFSAITIISEIGADMD
ncbi:phospholipase D-like domain-containing protein, partial [uncultured Acetobacterium sp.]|uniref:phospholipase D-like domain-containing protein n=1 Tax=uncultured Acetobacterium sp. TaxID=217139 RepID=UPI0025F23AE9